MVRTFTQNDLIRFMYGEMSADESNEMKTFIRNNEDSKQDYYAYKKLMRKMDEIGFDPDPTSVNLILEESLKLKYSSIHLMN